MGDHLSTSNSQPSRANIHLQLDLQANPRRSSRHSTTVVSIRRPSENYQCTVRIESGVKPHHRNSLRRSTSSNVARNSSNNISHSKRSLNTLNVPPHTMASSSQAGPGMMLVDQQMWKYVRVIQSNNSAGSFSQCPICLMDCIPGGTDLATTVVELVRCRHQMHLQCLNEMLKGSVQTNAQEALFIKCPLCNAIYGEKRGNQPPGTMNWTTLHQSLPGYPNTRTIQITYHFHPGVQGSKHPHPGKPYTAYNFPRTCYLPDTDKGRLVLELLKVAFDRQLVFTVGRSLTTGRDNSIVWNDIHHKTEWNNMSGHGYPDDGFLDRCLQQLAGHGLSPESLNRPSGGY